MLNLKLLDSNSKIEKEILNALTKEVNSYFSKTINKIKQGISPIVYEAVYNSPEMQSVRSGVLRLDFGITFDPTTSIANAVADSVSVNFQQFKLTSGKISSGLSVNVQPSDYMNVLSLPGSFVITEKGVKLPWLEWLSLYGNQIIIADFGVEYKSGKGRTGGAHMIVSTRPFRVNSSFAGTAEDNFISRSIELALPKIQKAIESLS